MTSKRAQDDDRWPVWAQVTLALTALAFGGILMIGMPLLVAGYLGKVTGDAGGLAVWGPMIATLLGLTTMTVAGIFLFMTFRIDRGVRLRTTVVAEDIAEEVAKETAVKRVDDFLAGKDIQTKLDKLLESATAAAGEFQSSLDSKAAEAESVLGGLRDQVDEADVEAALREAVEAHLAPEHVDEKVAEWLNSTGRRALAVEELQRATEGMTPKEALEFVEALTNALRNMQRTLDPEATVSIGQRIARWFRRRNA